MAITETSVVAIQETAEAPAAAAEPGKAGRPTMYHRTGNMSFLRNQTPKYGLASGMKEPAGS